MSRFISQRQIELFEEDITRKKNIKKYNVQTMHCWS